MKLHTKIRAAFSGTRSMTDEMTKLDQIREIAEEHGQDGFDKIMKILNA